MVRLKDLISVIKQVDLASFICEEKCRCCRRTIVSHTGNSAVALCAECRGALSKTRQSLFWIPLETETKSEQDTTNGGIPLLAVATAGMYEEVLQKLIRRLKYDDDRLVVVDIAPILERAYQTLLSAVPEFRLRGNTVIVPVPLHWTRLKKRGYNQAQLLADALSRSSGHPVNSKVLRRVRRTRPQFGLGKQERLDNVNRAFSLGKVNIEDKAIILVDDVFTSGSTLTTCAQLLTAGGARTVAAIAAARAPYDRNNR